MWKVGRLSAVGATLAGFINANVQNIAAYGWSQALTGTRLGLMNMDLASFGSAVAVGGLVGGIGAVGVVAFSKKLKDTTSTGLDGLKAFRKNKNPVDHNKKRPTPMGHLK